MEKNHKWYLKYRPNSQASIRLFCFHHSGGGASTYYRWLDHISDKIELIGIQLPGRENRFTEPLENNIRDIIVKLGENFFPYREKPFFVFGHSLGALIGFEFVQFISQFYSISPCCIIVSAAKAPHLPYRRKALSQLDNATLKEELKAYNGIDMNILDNDELLSLFLPIIKSDFSILEKYQYSYSKPLPCDILALSGAEDLTVNEKEILAWSAHTTGNFKHLSFSGKHFFLRNHKKKIVEMINKIGDSHILIKI